MEFDRNKVEPLESAFRYGNPKEEGPVVTKLAVHSLIVDEVARVIEDDLATIDLHPLEDVRTVTVIDVYP